MKVKKIIEILELEPQRATDPAGFMVYLNAKNSKKKKQLTRVIGEINDLQSIADENGGEALLEEVEAAIAYKEKKDKNK